MTMGQVLRDEEARSLVASIENPITQHLVTNAMFHFFKRYNEEQQRPASDFDMLYFVLILRDAFAEHDALRRILDGEKVGAFFSDE